MPISKNNSAVLMAAAAILLHSTPVHSFSTMVSATAQSCDGTESFNGGAVGVADAAVSASSAGMCTDGSSSSAVSSSSTSIALGSVSTSGEGAGFQEFNGSFGQASFGERLTVENVPAGIDAIDVRVVISFVGVPPAPAFYNSASMDAYANPQGIPGEVRLSGCSGDLCFGGAGPVRTDTLDQTVTLPRNGLGTFGNIDIFMDARFAIASTQAAIDGSMTVEVLNVPEAVIVSESGLFGTGGGVDTDSDGVVDSSDNCTLVANPDQIDTNGDGYGNFCDPDLNDDGFVNFLDLDLMGNAFFGTDPDADLDSSGIVNFIDLNIMAAFFFGPPGPSGLVP